MGRNKAGKSFITLDKGEKPLTPAPVKGATLNAISAEGRLLLFPLADMPEMAKGRGNKILDLDAKDELAAVCVNFGNSLTIEGAGRGGKPSSTIIEGRDLEAFRGQRARKGQLATLKLKPGSLS